MSTDRSQEARPEEEVEGDIRGRARPGHGRPHQGMVYAPHQADLQGEEQAHTNIREK